MLDRLTEDARRVLVMADSLAKSKKSSEITPAHLREAIRRVKTPPFSDASKEVLEKALRLSIELLHHSVTIEHLEKALDDAQDDD